MKTDDFDFFLPAERIAHYPASPRDSARLLVVTKTGRLQDRMIMDLADFLLPEDILIFNDTRVIPARLKARRSPSASGSADVSFGPAVEILLHKNISTTPAMQVWQALAKPARKLKAGDSLVMAEDFTATVEAILGDGHVRVRFDMAPEGFYDGLERVGVLPLPPYIKRAVQAEDAAAYQTIYATHKGAVAAPTAGLHFTEQLFDRLDTLGVQRAFVTLHVGAGTFLPVKAQHIEEHTMHHEWGRITPEVATAIKEARARGGRVVAVGTTSLRLLESAYDPHVSGNNRDGGFCGETDIFITPGYSWRCVDMLLTNFHLPRSTLFMLVAAFSGLERMHHAYAHAIEQDYRFFSYGDACLLERL